MTLDELINDKNIKLIEGCDSLMKQVLKETAERFVHHPSSASLSWARSRYFKKLRENNHGN